MIKYLENKYFKLDDNNKDCLINSFKAHMCNRVNQWTAKLRTNGYCVNCGSTHTKDFAHYPNLGRNDLVERLISKFGILNANLIEKVMEKLHKRYVHHIGRILCRFCHCLEDGRKQKNPYIEIIKG